MATDHDFKIKNGARVSGEKLILGSSAFSQDSNYVGLKTSAMTGSSEYMIISSPGDKHTYISAGSGRSVHIRGGGNNSAHQLVVSAAGASFAGDLTVSGNFTVSGTTTTLNTATLNVEDKNITLNYGSGDTSGSANGSGITIQDAMAVNHDATILWDTSNDRFNFSDPVNIDIVGPNNTPSADALTISGYGIIGNRSANVYITNSNSSGGVQIGVGGAHNANAKLTVSSSAATFTVPVTSTYFLASGADSTPAGTTFANAFNGDTRVAYFDGDATASVWWGSGNNPYAAVDAVDGQLKLYVNDTSGNWYERIRMTSSGVTNYANTTVIGNYVNLDSTGYAFFGADGANNQWKYLSLRTNGTTNWDIATKNDDAGGSLQFRPGGSHVNRTYMDTSGNWVFEGDLTTYTSDGATNTNKVNLGRGGAITFYGNANHSHSIMGRNGSGNISDNIRINTYAGLYINLDSNSNNTSNADFVIGNHGGGTGTISTLFTLSGENGDITATGQTNTFYSAASNGSLAVGRGATQSIKLFVNDGDNTITAYQDADSNSTHNFILQRDFDGTGANNFLIRKGTSTQLQLDTNANASFYGNLYIPHVIYHSGDGDTYMQFLDNQVNLVAGGNNVFNSNGGFREKIYTSGYSSTSGQWYTLFTISENTTPVYVTLKNGAHSTSTFVVTTGYSGSNEADLTVLSSTWTQNGGYPGAQRVRVVKQSNNAYHVQVKLYWTSSTISGFSLYCRLWGGTAVSALPTFVSSLSADTGSPTVIREARCDLERMNFSATPYVGDNTMWTAANDGSGSGLDADLLDGLHESTFMRRTANSGLNMGNHNISNVNALTFNDPGAGEGIKWNGGNQWQIYESPNNLTNATGNLQFTSGSSNGTRRMTLDTGGNLEVTGNITHDGLTPTSGTDIDQIYTVTDSLTLTTSWQDTSINSSELATGTYILQMHTNDNGNGGSHYSEYYSGIISWYGSSTNSNEVDEIVLHRAGHAPNASVIHLRTQRHASGGDNLRLQIKANYTRTAASNYTFKFRRMI